MNAFGPRSRVGVKEGLGVSVMVGVNVSVWVGVDVAVAVGVGVLVDVAASVAVGVGDGKMRGTTVVGMAIPIAEITKVINRRVAILSIVLPNQDDSNGGVLSHNKFKNPILAVVVRIPSGM